MYAELVPGFQLQQWDSGARDPDATACSLPVLNKDATRIPVTFKVAKETTGTLQQKEKE